MLNRNPGLRDICHSITGGALVAQGNASPRCTSATWRLTREVLGYWMPFEAARAVAATFCWKIRYALTPVFGPEFPSQCIPSDSEKFGEMTIDPSITQFCTRKAKEYKDFEERLSSRGSAVVSTTVTPDSSHPSSPSKHLQSPTSKVVHSSNGCGSDSSPDRRYVLSPLSTYSGIWTPANTPRSISNVVHQYGLPSPQGTVTDVAGESVAHKEELDIRGSYSPTTTATSVSNEAHKKYSTDEDYEGDDSDISTSSEERHEKMRPKRQSIGASRWTTNSVDEKAAYLLMSMRLAATDLNDATSSRRVLNEPRDRKRRAST